MQLSLWLRFWLLLAVSVALILAIGCTTMIDQHRAPPSDWPSLAVTAHIVSAAEMRNTCLPVVTQKHPCAQRLSAFAVIEACALVDFRNKTCNIWLADIAPEHREHEELHCRGYDHTGDGTLACYWAAWKIEVEK